MTLQSSQLPFALGAFADNQWTRVQLASVLIDPCDQEHCSMYALHRMRVAQWLTPPTRDRSAWSFVSRRAGEYMLHYYCRQIPRDATVPQIMDICDILFLKLDGCGNVADMTAQDVTWVKDNMMGML